MENIYITIEIVATNPRIENRDMTKKIFQDKKITIVDLCVFITIILIFMVIELIICWCLNFSYITVNFQVKDQI